MSTESKSKEMEATRKDEIDRDAGEPTREGVWFRPTVDIYETDQAITLLADMPGVTREELDIDLREDTLTVTGRVTPPQESRKLIYGEYDVGGFTRQFRVGEAVDQSKITAQLTDGVLEMTLPKAEKLQPRKIEVQTK
jgi:HSP20 family protein